MLLLSLSCDVALNPGPDSINSSQASMNETKYSCGYCDREVTWSNVMSLMCDNCEAWYHTDCQGIGDTTFDILGQSNATWHCNLCKFPNYSHGLFESQDTLSDTSVLSLSLDSTTHSNITNLTDSPKPPDTPGQPQATSSPKEPPVSKSKHDKPKRSP